MDANLVFWSGAQLHSVRAACDSTVSINHRPWRNSAVRELRQRILRAHREGGQSAGEEPPPTPAGE